MPTVWNINDRDPRITLINNNLTARLDSAGDGSVRSTLFKTSGKWYFEMTGNWLSAASEGSDILTGIMGPAPDLINGDPGSDVGNNSWGIYYVFGQSSFFTITDGSNTNLFVSGVDGDTIGVCLDVDNFKFYLRKNGTNILGDPVALTGGQAILTGSWTACVGGSRVATVIPMLTANFGATNFRNAAPSGFTAWDTSPFAYNFFEAPTTSITVIQHGVGT